jgi:hypothetical protein
MLPVPKRMQAQTPSHARSKQQEAEVAAKIGGVQVRRSGAGVEKGDVRLKNFVRVEAKTTKNKSFSVTEEILDKLDDSVLGSGEVPLFHIEILGGRRKCVVLPEWSLELIVEALENKRNA